MQWQSTLVRPFAALVVMLFAATGCETAYIETLEKFGIEKRELLVDRVESARDSQEEAKEEFASALEEFRSVVQFDGGELEQKYDQLNGAFEDSESAAEDVRDRINAVESVAEALFEEWAEETEQYSSASLKRSSEKQLRETRTRYSGLMAAMRRAESRMDPVLDAFRDQVLYLKHNLNARAIASLEGELGTIESDIERLVREMEQAIDASNAFLEDHGLL